MTGMTVCEAETTWEFLRGSAVESEEQCVRGWWQADSLHVRL